MVRGRRARFFRLFRFSILHISPGPLPPPPPPCQLPRDSLYSYNRWDDVCTSQEEVSAIIR